MDATYRRYFPFWDGLSAEDKEFVLSQSTSLHYAKGERIHDSSECTGLFLVKSGRLRIYMLSEEGKEITLYRLAPGNVCMLSASCVIQSITFDVFVDAEEESECFLVSASAFGVLSERIPAVKIFALETAVSRFSDVMWVMQQIMFMSMDKRLAIFLLDEAALNGNDTVTLTHEQIARHMGTAREVVSRLLKHLAADGIVASSRGGITILDKKRLLKIAA